MNPRLLLGCLFFRLCSSSSYVPDGPLNIQITVWAMRGVSCTLPPPLSTMYSHPRPAATTLPPTTTTILPTTTRRQHPQTHRPRGRHHRQQASRTRRRTSRQTHHLPALQITLHNRPQALQPEATSEACRHSGRLSPPLAFQVSLSSTTTSSSAMPRAVRPHFFSNTPRRTILMRRLIVTRLDTLLHTYQGARRWLLWHRPPLRLARHPAPKHSAVAHAVWARRTPRVGR